MILSIEEPRTRNGDKEIGERREETGKRRSLYNLYPVSYNLRPVTRHSSRKKGIAMTTEASIIRGLENVVVASTALSAIDGTAGRLSYTGYDIHDLAERATFEEVFYLLWY